MGKLCHHEDWEINGLLGNKDISEAREELGALERERQKMEEHKLELERQLTELDTQLTKFNEVSMHSLIWYIKYFLEYEEDVLTTASASLAD